MANVPEFTPVCETEAELDEIFGPVVAHDYSRVPSPMGGIANLVGSDPLSWPACWMCGKRRQEALVEMGHECASCHGGWFDKHILPMMRPFRRSLPDAPRAA